MPPVRPHNPAVLLCVRAAAPSGSPPSAALRGSPCSRMARETPPHHRSNRAIPRPATTNIRVFALTIPSPLPRQVRRNSFNIDKFRAEFLVSRPVRNAPRAQTVLRDILLGVGSGRVNVSPRLAATLASGLGFHDAAGLNRIGMISKEGQRFRHALASRTYLNSEVNNMLGASPDKS